MAIVRQFPSHPISRDPDTGAQSVQAALGDLGSLNATLDSLETRLGALLQADSSQFLTDIGRAQLFAQCFSGWLYYQPDTKLWAVWHQECGRWLDEHDPHGQAAIHQIAQEFLLRMHQIMDDRRVITGPDLLSGRCLRELIRNAQHQASLLRPSSEFNTNPYLLGVANGVVDLRTGNVYERAREAYVTLHCPVPYYSKRIHSKLWNRFLLDVTGDDAGYRSFLRDYLGSMLCGHNAHETFSLLHGPGGTGKGTLIRTIQSILGPYAMTLNPESLSKRAAAGIREDLAAMAGRRLVFVPEMSDEATLDLMLIKTLTGGDTVRARKLHQNGVVMKPTWSLLVGTNHWPRFSTEPDSGWWRRIVVMPFDRIPPLPDPDLKAKLAEPQEQVSILSWLIEGAINYFYTDTNKHGWRYCACVREAKAEYRLEYDHLNFWIEDCTRKGLPCDRVTNSQIWASYHTWREHYGIEHETTSTHIGRALAKAGYRRALATGEIGSVRGWRGLVLQEPRDPAEDQSKREIYVRFGDFEV